MNAMTEQNHLLAETVDKLFRDLMEAEAPEPDHNSLSAALWNPVEENGVTSVLLPEDAGGFGGNWQDAFIVLNRAGFYAVPLPLAETLLAQHLLVRAEIDVPAGAIAVAAHSDASLQRSADGSWSLNGSATAVAWGAATPHALIACRHNGASYLALLQKTAWSVTAQRRTIAREPVADLAFDNAAVIAAAPLPEDVFALCALLRTAQIAGALNAALRQSATYANERSQFGKPIGRFQAIQQSLAILAGEAAAVNCAALAACRAVDLGDAGFEIAAAKLRANRAVGIATSIAHQVHGAIGFTREHSLHNATQRLWCWRSEFGNDRYWSTRLGKLVAQRGSENLWPDLTARSDRY